jgi:hypothetical protein
VTYGLRVFGWDEPARVSPPPYRPDQAIEGDEMTDINETITEILRLDEEATPGPWEPFAGSVVREGETAYLVHGGPDTDAALVAYYRTAAPALAREVQRLQAEVERLREEIKRSRPSCVVCGMGVHVDSFCGDACYNAYYDLTE